MGLVIIRIGAARHSFQHSKKEVLTRSPVAIARKWTVATSGSSRKSNCNVGTQVTTLEESHPPEQEVRSRATAHHRSRATAYDRNRARAHDIGRSIEIMLVQGDRPHEAIDHTEEGFKSTRGAFESKRYIQSYKHQTNRSRRYEDQRLFQYGSFPCLFLVHLFLFLCD